MNALPRHDVAPPHALRIGAILGIDVEEGIPVRSALRLMIVPAAESYPIIEIPCGASFSVQRRAPSMHWSWVTARTGMAAVVTRVPLPPVIVIRVTTHLPPMMRPELEYVSLPVPSDCKRSMFGILSAETTTPVDPVSITTP